MGEFGPVVQTLALAVLDTGHNVPLRCGVALQFVGHQLPRGVTQALKELAEKALRRLPVAPALYEDIVHMTILVDRMPTVVMPALDG